MDEAVVELHELSNFRLRGVSLTVRAGERVAIVGRSGEGKSVLVRLMLGLMKADRGEVTLLGQRLREPVNDVPGLAVAFQSPGLLDGWTIRQNIEAAVGRVLADAEIHALLMGAGLQNVPLDASPRMLSGGQQKRVSLIRALVRGTRLLILDEPTSGLDPETAAEVVQFLGREIARSSPTVVLITHDYEAARRLCTRTLCLTAAGTVEELSADASDEAGIREVLRRQRREEERAVDVEPPTWGVAAATEDFIAQALPLSVGTMLPLGAMLVAQSAGMAAFDVSPRIPEALVGAVFRELAPLIVGLVVSARISSRISAEIAGMSYTAQLDSMRVLGISRSRTLLLPFTVAAAAVFPICIVAGGVSAIAGGVLLAAVGYQRLTIGASRFLSLSAGAFDPIVIGSCVLKGIVAGIVIGVFAYRTGSRPIHSSADLGRAVTRSVVGSAIAVIVVDILFSLSILS